MNDLTLEGTPTHEQITKVLGETPMKDVISAVARDEVAMNGLLRALVKEMCADPDAVEWVAHAGDELAVLEGVHP